MRASLCRCSSSTGRVHHGRSSVAQYHHKRQSNDRFVRGVLRLCLGCRQLIALLVLPISGCSVVVTGGLNFRLVSSPPVLHSRYFVSGCAVVVGCASYCVIFSHNQSPANVSRLVYSIRWCLMCQVKFRQEVLLGWVVFLGHTRYRSQTLGRFRTQPLLWV